MILRIPKRYWILLATATLLVGCEIDQGDSSGPVQTVQTAAVTYGPIDAFGSIILNGETIPIANAVVLVNGFPAAESNLNIGQVVRVVSLIEDGRADALLVDYRSNVIGPIEAVDPQTGTLTVLGQTTTLRPGAQLNIPGVATLADLNVGNVVEISALSLLDGSLFATYVGEPSLNNQFALGTMITAVDLNAMQFTLGGITIDYSQASVIDVPGGQPAVGQIVFAIGIALGAGGELIADQVLELNAEPGVFGTSDTDLQTAGAAGLNVNGLSGFDANLVGFIVMSDNATTLTIGDVTISFDVSTSILGGAAGDLNAGTLVQIKGEVTSLGDIRAIEISIL